MELTKRDFALAGAATVLAGTVGTAVTVDTADAKQPNMDKAMDHLRQARASLEKANANKGGHRAKAINLIDQAIDQVKLGKQFASS